MKHMLFPALLAISLASFSQSTRRTENVILITLDGMRWQEVFGGADSSLMRQQKNFKDENLKQKFWNDDPAVRRKMLMPFLWTTVATQGQLYGNRILGNKANVTNNQWFSYPGYSEILIGFADNERIHSNDKFYNPNTTVLEFVNTQPGFQGKVAAFTSWDVFPFIIHDKRSKVLVNSGEYTAQGDNLNVQEQLMNKLMATIPNPLAGVRLDAFTFYYGMEFIKRNKPRVFYFSFDETDDFAHAGEYAAYLNSARNTDQFIAELYSYLETEPFYKGKTTLLITVDHGRGTGQEDWKHHGIKIKDADQIWMGFLGPDTPARGEVNSPTQVYQNQLAQTLALFLGLKYVSDRPSGQPVDGIRKN